MLSLTLLATACGDDSPDKIGFDFAGKPQPGVPSRVAWQAHLDHKVDNLAVDSGTFVVTSEFLGISGITALDATSGATLFDDRVDALPRDLDGVLAFGGGRLLVGASGDGGVNGRVDAFDATAGTKLWSAPLDLDDPLPVIVGDAVVIANHDPGASTGHVHLYALADGAERWSTPLSIAPVAKPESNDHDRSAPLLAVDGSTLTVRTGTGTSLAGIDLRAGTVAFEYDAGRPVLEVRPIEAKDRVVVLTTGANDTDLQHRVAAVSIRTGELAWSQDTYDNRFVVNGDDVLVKGDSDGTWNAFDIASGSLHWNNYGDGSSIVATSGNFAVTDGLSVFDLTTGERAWGTGRYQTSEDLHVVGDVVLGNSLTHNPTAYDLATGDQLWTLTDGFVLRVLEPSGTVLTQNDDVVELRDLRSGAVLWKLTVGDKIGVRTTTDADGNLYIILDKYRQDIATIVAITPPTA